MLRYRRFHGYGVIAVSRKEARSKVVFQDPEANPLEAALRFGRQWLGRYRHLRLLRMLMGSSSANAQIPNPFNKKTPKDQAAQRPRKRPAQKDTAAPRAGQTTQDVMAVVNGQDIKRDAFGHRLRRAISARIVLEGLVNKRLIMHYCRNRNIEVTDADVDAEVDHVAKKLKVGRDQFLQLIERERGITAEQYKRDIVWPCSRCGSVRPTNSPSATPN